MEENLTDGEERTLEDIILEHKDAQEHAEMQIETASESSTETKVSAEESEKPSQGGDSNPEESLPFHKHPRWKQQLEENKALRQQLEELQTFRQQVEPLIPQAPAPSEPLPKWWVDLYGETPEAYQVYLSHEKEKEEALIEKAAQRIKSEEQRKIDEANNYNKWIESEMSAMESEGLKFNRNELNKFLVDFQAEYGTLPLTANGQIDFRKGLQMFQKFTPPKTDVTEAKKQVATKSAPTNSTTSNEPKAPKVGSLYNKRWSDFLN